MKSVTLVALLFALLGVITPVSLGQLGTGSCWYGVGTGCGTTGGIGFFGWIPCP